ncbi:MAG: response regulator [Anaerolineales bacterium]|nr:response regulator [Anaerolineales bacterium]
MTHTRKILLVDDEPLILRSMQKTLLRAGYIVATARNCTEGLAAYEAAQGSDAPFHIALLDLNMPGFDGGETSGAGMELISAIIKRQPEFPIIVLSAYDDVGKVKEAVARGARGYCVKGREKTLLDQINHVFEENS